MVHATRIRSPPARCRPTATSMGVLVRCRHMARESSAGMLRSPTEGASLHPVGWQCSALPCRRVAVPVSSLANNHSGLPAHQPELSHIHSCTHSPPARRHPNTHTGAGWSSTRRSGASCVTTALTCSACSTSTTAPAAPISTYATSWGCPAPTHTPPPWASTRTAPHSARRTPRRCCRRCTSTAAAMRSGSPPARVRSASCQQHPEDPPGVHVPLQASCVERRTSSAVGSLLLAWADVDGVGTSIYSTAARARGALGAQRLRRAVGDGMMWRPQLRTQQLLSSLTYAARATCERACRPAG